ncbi:hypothetical protein [Frankia sp. Cas3]|uniref:hypothetical protein n=1 Tax=Frankia sp. Cas3 TaxID=3073926 RepID=UPI002AD43143|nr:hypothetical protein [Frankia sp. Cas3]
MIDMPESSRLRNLRISEWSLEESINFEVAVDALNQVVAQLSALIAAEREKSGPDARSVETWLSERQRIAEIRRSLRVDDPEQVRQVTEQAVTMLKTLPAVPR